MVNWDAVSAVAELLGAIGVIASLLYLAVQVRTGNRAAAVEAKLQTTELLNQFNDFLIQFPELDSVMRKGRRTSDSLSREEYVRYSRLMLKTFWFMSACYFQHRQGTLLDEDWFEARMVLRYFLSGDGCRQWWAEQGRALFTGQFVGFIEAELADLARERDAAGSASDA